MIINKKSSENINQHDMENGDISSSSILFPYPFVFRNREQLNEYISTKLTSNGAVYYTKLVLGLLTLILPLFNAFSIYRNIIYQREDFSDVYSAFHAIIFYGEFAIVHVLLLITLILFIIHSIKDDYSSSLIRGRWIIFFDTEFTLMAFNMIKMVPVLSVNGFNFLCKQICICVPIFRMYSRSSQIIAFTVLVLVIFIQLIFLLGVIILMILVKVYQISFVGELRNPLEWTINYWLLFIGFAANIINITDTPTISQLSFMWEIPNQTWSSNLNLWLHDKLASKRKAYLFNQICQTLGFVKAFLWVRTMSAIDLHCLIRLPPSDEDTSKRI
jgi:hypothetical protein